MSPSQVKYRKMNKINGEIVSSREFTKHCRTTKPIYASVSIRIIIFEWPALQNGLHAARDCSDP